MMSRKLVSFAKDEGAAYPPPPFSPSERYPEYPFTDVGSEPNRAYDLVRKCLIQAGPRPRAGRNLLVESTWRIDPARG